MESNHFLTASRVYLLSKAIYKNLDADANEEVKRSVKVMVRTLNIFLPKTILSPPYQCQFVNHSFPWLYRKHSLWLHGNGTLSVISKHRSFKRAHDISS